MKTISTQKHEQGYTLVELVAVVAGILALTVGTVALGGQAISKANTERVFHAATATMYSQALDAETGFDDTVDAQTVLEEWNTKYDDMSFRAEGESFELCIYAAHEQIEGEISVGDCGIERQDPPPRPEEEYRTFAVRDIKCLYHPHLGMADNEIIYMWERPLGWSKASMEYEVQWNDSSGANAPKGVSLEWDALYLTGSSGTHVFDSNQASGFQFTVPHSETAGTTAFTVTPIADGKRLESISFTTKEVDEPNTSGCQTDENVSLY